MDFALTSEQRAFANSLNSLLAAPDTPAVNRAWAEGDFDPGRQLWARLAEQGVTALLVEEDAGGMGAGLPELAVAFEALGRHAVPGPWIESAAWLPQVLTGEALTNLAEGTIATVAPDGIRAVDAAAAEACWAAVDGDLTEATAGDAVAAIDPARTLSLVSSGAVIAPIPEAAFETAALAAAAYLLGAGERLLEESVTYAGQRTQFGRQIGSYQAVKHLLADVRVALDFARPLIWGAACEPGPRAVSAAKVRASDAAWLAARTALQVHGAIGYTREHDVSIWILRVRALRNAWGTGDFHRQRVLTSLVSA